ncbi:MMPL family transporter [Streptomyces sp. NPDC007162]|uniref:MMPL family transporter n=1 Tax=Streptomyces sp. NPDC007162 TaxID=3156917 RepID=UPI0033C83604
MGERLRPSPGSRAARREQAAHSNGQHGGHGARRTTGEHGGRIAIRKPLLTLLAVLVGQLAIAVPARYLQLALPDNGSAPTSSRQRQAYDTISDKFGPGFNGPLLVHADTSHATDAQAATATLAKYLKAADGVAAVGKPQVIDHGEAAVIQVVPKTGPSDQKTKDLVQHIRDEAPTWQQQTQAEVSVTGTTAVNIDVSDRSANSLIPFAPVVGLSLLLLLLVFRSVIVPLKASLGFLLSVAATFGAVVAVFQWGWLARPASFPNSNTSPTSWSRRDRPDPSNRPEPGARSAPTTRRSPSRSVDADAGSVIVPRRQHRLPQEQTERGQHPRRLHRLRLGEDQLSARHHRRLPGHHPAPSLLPLLRQTQRRLDVPDHHSDFPTAEGDPNSGTIGTWTHLVATFRAPAPGSATTGNMALHQLDGLTMRTAACRARWGAVGSAASRPNRLPIGVRG